MKKNDVPLVVGFRRLSWLLGIIAAIVLFLVIAPRSYIIEAAAVALIFGGAVFGIARILVLVVRGFRQGKGEEPKAVTGFKRLSWFAAAVFGPVTGLLVGFYVDEDLMLPFAVVTAAAVFPIFRFLLLWIVRGFIGEVQNEKTS